MKHKKNVHVKRQNSMHTQINCKNKLEIKNNNDIIFINNSKKNFDLENNNNNPKKDINITTHHKRNSFQFNQKIFLKAIDKKNCENLKQSINTPSTNIKKEKISSKSGKNVNKFRNVVVNTNSKFKKNDKKKLELNCFEKEIKPKSLSDKDIPLNLEDNEEKDKNDEEEEKEKNIDYEYKDDKIEIIYNSSNNYIYSSGTQKGFFIKNKIEKENNQDVALILEDVCGIKNYNIYCIMDGHGSNGHLISKYIKEKITQNLNNISFYFKKLSKTSSNIKYPDNILELIKNKLEKNNYKKIKDFYKLIDDGLSANEIFFDINFSGSTCIILFQIGNYLICSNVGDSRAIMVKENNEIIELSKDQKPDDEKEKIRIEKMGGIISQCNDLYDDGKEGGPFRIWVKGRDYPGIAMSRSIGDKIAHDIGVISEPEIFCFNINDKCEYLVIGSDGIWQYLENENVSEIIRPFFVEKNAENAVKEIIRKSSLAWIEKDKIADDITVSVIFLKV